MFLRKMNITNESRLEDLVAQVKTRIECTEQRFEDDEFLMLEHSHNPHDNITNLKGLYLEWSDILQNLKVSFEFEIEKGHYKDKTFRIRRYVEKGPVCKCEKKDCRKTVIMVYCEMI